MCSFVRGDIKKFASVKSTIILASEQKIETIEWKQIRHAIRHVLVLDRLLFWTGLLFTLLCFLCVVQDSFFRAGFYFKIVMGSALIGNTFVMQLFNIYKLQLRKERISSSISKKSAPVSATFHKTFVVSSAVDSVLQPHAAECDAMRTSMASDQ